MNTGLDNLEKMKLLRRRRERTERETQRKEDNHWCFVAGTLVAKYLKTDLRWSTREKMPPRRTRFRSHRWRISWPTLPTTKNLPLG